MQASAFFPEKYQFTPQINNFKFRHLLSFLPMFSVVSFLLFQTISYIFIWFYVRSQNWWGRQHLFNVSTFNVGPLSTSHFFTGLSPTSLSRTSTPLTQGLCLHFEFYTFFPLFLPLIQSPSVCYEQNNISFCKLLDNKPMAKLDCPQRRRISCFPSYEQTNIYLYACAATVIAAIIFSKGSPYRQPLYRNGQFLMKSRSEGFLFLHQW